MRKKDERFLRITIVGKIREQEDKSTRVGA